MRVIGVDPGSRFTGYGVVEKSGSHLIHIDCGVIVPPGKAALAERLLYISDHLKTVLQQFTPDTAAMEDVFFSKNWRSALKLGQARGAALTALASANLTVSGYAPTMVKKAVVGNGRAEKTQVQQMIKVLLGLPEVPEENAADALAVAICRLHNGLDDLTGLMT